MLGIKKYTMVDTKKLAKYKLSTIHRTIVVQETKAIIKLSKLR